MNIADICTREVVMTDRASTLQQAATLMREKHVGALLVTASAGERAHVVGVVTDRDVVIEAVARGLDPRQAEIGRLAEGNLAVVPASASVDEAISLMKTRGVRRLVVSGESGQLFGIVSMDDLLAALSHEMAELARAARTGIERESAERGKLEPAPQARPVHIPAYSFT
jgi:predicted transcriptional regulator